MEKHFDERKALQLIEETIAIARRDFRESGFDLILWGWLMMGASLSHYVIEQMEYPPFPSFVGWIFFSVLGGIVSSIYHHKENKNKKAVSYTNSTINYVWAGFGISLFVTLFVTIARSPYAIYPMCLCLMAYGTYLTGRITRFKWMVYGSYASWLLAIVSFNASYDNQILFYSFGLLLTYLIPGYLANKEYKRSQMPTP